MESKLQLQPGETLHFISSKSKGSLAETDINEYEIKNQNGDVVGTVVHKDTTSRRGKRTQEVVQKDISGDTIVDTSW